MLLLLVPRYRMKSTNNFRLIILSLDRANSGYLYVIKSRSRENCEIIVVTFTPSYLTGTVKGKEGIYFFP